MPVKYKGKHWDVDVDGCACLLTPGIPTVDIAQVPSAQLVRVLRRVTEEKLALIDTLARTQTRLDEVTQIESEMTAMSLLVTAEPV